MKKFFRKSRLVYACGNFFGGLFRLVAALIDMASNYTENFRWWEAFDAG